MAESRIKMHHILLSTSGKNTALEIFDASQWPDVSSDDNNFRVRIDGKWYSPAGKYTFLDYAGLGALVADILSGQELPIAEAPPRIEARQRVRVHHGDCVDGMPCKQTVVWTTSPPFRSFDGRWHVHVSLEGSIIAVPVHDVEPWGHK